MPDSKTVEIGWNLDNSYAQLPKKFYSIINPAPVLSPELIVLNGPLAKSLGFNISGLESKMGIEFLAGNKVPNGSLPLAQAYTGHQYGHFVMLGDGRAILLGEQITPKGERFDVQLKGAGRTPYSRGGDGRAGLGPMLREYIISEAMHALKIPTTRSLGVVTTGESIIRETKQQGAILTRIASSHIRVGTFEYASQKGSIEELRLLADYTINRHFPNVEDQENQYLSLLEEIIKRQALLVSKWQLVGFIHGVMNTDNMAIAGETIDYGPCAFMDIYDPKTVFSSIDVHGRYAYGNQPKIAQWNLARLAESLLPLIHTNQEKAVELVKQSISDFDEVYHYNWINGMRAKLGLYNEETDDETLVKDLLEIMHKYGADYTNTFRGLTLKRLEGDSEMFSSSEFIKWKNNWESRLSRQNGDEASFERLMRESNPAVIPRNHRVEEALEAAENGNYKVMEDLLEVLSNPFEYTKKQEAYTTLPPKSFCSYKTFCGT